MIPALRQGSRKIGWSCGTAYATAFYVTNSCTVKAYATCFDYLDSAVATQAIEKVWGIGDAGRIVICTVMFVGRMGPLFLISAVAKKQEQGMWYAEEDIMVG